MRAYRWRERRATGELDDRSPGGSPMHGLLDDEIQAIIDLYHAWGEIDRSHRKLAHRGSYTNTVWVAPSSVRPRSASNESRDGEWDGGSSVVPC